MKYKLIIVLFFIGGVLQSCDIAKKAIKQKTSSTTLADVSKKETQKAFDFSTVNTEHEDFKFEPADPSKYMQIITSKGDTLQTKNTSISRSKSKSSRRNNLETNIASESNDQSISKRDTTDKFQEKTESFNTTWMLYLICGLVVVSVFGIIAALFMISKKLDRLL